MLGAVSTATIVRIDTDRPRVAYLEYPEFDSDPHPALQGAYTATLDSLRSDYTDYSERDNPPILHRKELFVSEDHPLHGRFERLTKQEVRAGLSPRSESSRDGEGLDRSAQ